jgi:hypothetical protein
MAIPSRATSHGSFFPSTQTYQPRRLFRTTTTPGRARLQPGHKSRAGRPVPCCRRPECRRSRSPERSRRTESPSPGPAIYPRQPAASRTASSPDMIILLIIIILLVGGGGYYAGPGYGYYGGGIVDLLLVLLLLYFLLGRRNRL